mmetsp:Transcript_5208/g.14766  ORF Transcript_5208/g.14766 Transcript_5208/m.14766 type:complete len:468 (-) Transcript_5208:51-1454(-)
MASQIIEIEPTHVHTHGSKSTIRNFRLSIEDDSNNGIAVELSCLGASVTKLVVPNYSNDEVGASSDDVVLSYTSPLEQYDDKNSPYFGCIVGRVANRIRDGRFDLVQQEGETVSYQLDRNNGPNHLHGGNDGFCHRVWEAEIVGGGGEGEEGQEANKSVRFTLISPDGDQGYPGAIRVTAEYSLLRFEAEPAAKLCLAMRASLLPGETKSTPISLAQHSYFNLASHSHHAGILDHILCMPNSEGFTPVDNKLIPTREIQPVDIGNARCMDFRAGKCVGDALSEYGREEAGLPEDVATDNVTRRQTAADGAPHVARVPKKGGADGSNLDGGEPYGFDHNYILIDNGLRVGGNDSVGDSKSPTLAAILSHPPTRRCLRIFTTAPGLQLYTSNYLNGTNPMPRMCKEGQFYGQWQGLCLETQSFPDSIYRKGKETIPETEKEFAQGRCFILHPGGEEYSHTVEYLFGKMK